MSGRKFEKKLKTAPDSENEADCDRQVQIEGESESNSWVQKLPPEMQLNLLKYLDLKSLFACRLVNRIWNTIASEVCRSRVDLEIHFWHTINGDKQLLDFVHCFASSKNPNWNSNFPYSRFHFEGIIHRSFQKPGWINFTDFSSSGSGSGFGRNIKCLKLELKPTNVDQTMRKILNQVRSLLLNLPNLEEFGLNLSGCRPPSSSKLGIFSATSLKGKAKPETETTDRFSLPLLKVLYFTKDSFLKFPGIDTDLLVAAVNLRKIQYFDDCAQSAEEEIETFHFLQSLGKLDCLSTVAIELNDEFVSTLEVKSKSLGKTFPPLDFKLKKLHLKTDSLYKNQDEGIFSDSMVLDFISNLLDSSKDTLKEIRMESPEFCRLLQPPQQKFSKVTTLSIGRRFEDENPIQVNESIFISMLSSGMNLKEIFPVLRSLEVYLPWNFIFPQFESQSGPEPDAISCTNFSIPTLQTLKIVGCPLTETAIAQISSLCPNLINLCIVTEQEESLESPEFLENFTPVITAIWTRLRKLKNLALKIVTGHPAHDILTLDFSVSGFSRG